MRLCGLHVLLLCTLLPRARVRSASCSAKESQGVLSHVKKLRKDVFCSYDKALGPTKSVASNTSISFQLLRVSMDLDEDTNTLTVHGFLALDWMDEWLTWDQKAYGNVPYLNLDWSDIWTPGFALLESPTKHLRPSNIRVSNGSVFWSLTAPLEAPCVSSPRKWPYDSMICNLTVINFSHQDTKFKSEAFMNFHSFRVHGWLLRQITLHKFDVEGHEDGVRISFALVRSSGKFEATVVVPCIALGVLLLATTWLPADSTQRPALLCGLVLTQIFLSGGSALQVRVVADEAPGVFLLYRDCLFLSVLVLVQWLASRAVLCDGRSPSHLHGLLESLADSRASRILALGESRESPIAILVDRVAFLLFSLVFFILCFRLAP